MTQFEKGLQFFKSEDYKAAIIHFEAHLEEEPRHSSSYYYRGMSKYKMGFLPAALPDLDIAIELDKSNAEYYSDRGIIKYKMQMITAALNDFDMAVSLEPENPYRYSCRAWIKDRSGDSEGAVEDYKIAVKLDPEDEIAQNNMEFALESIQYKNQRPRFKSADAFTAEEKEAYQKMYDEKQEVPQQVKSKPTSGDYLNVIKKVLTSKEGFKEFLNFAFGRKG